VKCYRQCFCCELICGCPLESAYVNTAAVHSNVPTNDGSGNLDDAIPCSACLCSISSCYFSFPACLSCYDKATCLCCETEAACCRLLCCEQNRKKETLCIIFEKTNLFCMWPTTCSKVTSQLCCLDTRCAFPCDKDVPCLCMPLPFCTCCVNFQCNISCCKSVAQLTQTAQKKV
jgi:hypothetical protein